jgi:hypothetical protein
VQHEVVVPAGDRDRVELDRPALAKDRQHGFGAFLQRPRGREKVPRDEKATRRLSSDLHLDDTNCANADRLTKYVRRHRRRSLTDHRVAATGDERPRGTFPNSLSSSADGGVRCAQETRVGGG